MLWGRGRDAPGCVDSSHSISNEGEVHRCECYHLNRCEYLSIEDSNLEICWKWCTPCICFQYYCGGLWRLRQRRSGVFSESASHVQSTQTEAPMVTPTVTPVKYDQFTPLSESGQSDVQCIDSCTIRFRQVIMREASARGSSMFEQRDDFLDSRAVTEGPFVTLIWMHPDKVSNESNS